MSSVLAQGLKLGCFVVMLLVCSVPVWHYFSWSCRFKKTYFHRRLNTGTLPPNLSCLVSDFLWRFCLDFYWLLVFDRPPRCQLREVRQCFCKCPFIIPACQSRPSTRNIYRTLSNFHNQLKSLKCMWFETNHWICFLILLKIPEILF